MITHRDIIELRELLTSIAKNLERLADAVDSKVSREVYNNPTEYLNAVKPLTGTTPHE